MAALTFRQTKGSPLTNSEIDSNFGNLDNEKVRLGGDLGGSTSTPLVVKLYDRPLSSSAPVLGQGLVWDGANWSPGSGAPSTSTVVTTSVVVTTSTASLAQNFPYGFSAYASNTELQTITAGSQQKVKFQVTEWNIGNFYTTSTSRFQPTVEGYYQINSEIRFDGIMGPNNELLVALWKNGSEHKRGYNSTGVSPNAGGSTWFAMQVSSLVYFNGSTDYAEIYAQHGNSGSLTITGVNSPNITYFNAVMIPKMVSTSVSVNTTSNVTASSDVVAYGGVNFVNLAIKDISHQINSKTQVFTLKNINGGVLNGTEYTDSSDLQVVLDGRVLEPWIRDAARWAPWQTEYDAGRTNSFRMRGSKIIFYKQPRTKSTVYININTKSPAIRVRKYPLPHTNIAFGD